jgi:group I intron endonuclease
MEIVGIYKITSPSEKVYIGQSEDIKTRWDDYINLRNCKNQRRLYSSFMYYGVENHTFEIIKECEPHELNYYERHFQEYYNVIGEYGLNCILTNVGDKKKVYSEETRKKQSEAMKGKKHSEESKQKNRESQKKLYENGYIHPMQDKKRSEETRKKISESLTGKKVSEETRKKISEIAKGKKHSEGTKQKISEIRSKKVINTETNEIYKSLSEMCSILGLKYFTLANKLNGNRKNNTPFRYL